jgi:uncharacterized protein
MQTYDAPVHAANHNLRTWLVLLFVMLVFLPIRQITHWISPTVTTQSDIIRETLILATAAALLLYVRRVEGLSLQSVGLGTSVWWKSILWGLVTMVLCGAAAGLIVHVTHYTGGARAHEMDNLPTWLITVIVFRAGFAEELFYRGFAIERLTAMGWSRAAAALFPLTIFSLLHYTGGPVNILLAFVLGGILAAFYLWRRDLVANIIAHFLVDFLANVLPRFVK